MIFHNMARHLEIRRVMNAVAAGTSDQNSSVVDMQGYESVLFLPLFGTLTATQVTKVKVQQGSAADGSDMADLAGTLSASLADGDSNKIGRPTEVFRPTKRYVRLVIDRGTANAVIDGVIALLGRGGTLPPSLHTTVAIAPAIFNTPAEGTA